MIFFIRINATEDNASNWGELKYAEGLIKSLAELGVESQICYRNKVPTRKTPRDVVVSIVGPMVEEPIVGFPNILWIISPPNIAPVSLLKRYQKVFAASRLYVQSLIKSGISAKTLEQATDTNHFDPKKSKHNDPHLPIVFVGAFASRVPRKSIVQVAEAGFDLSVWGPGWSGVIPPKMWRGERLDHDQLATVYASARVVLNSHMPHMAKFGFMSNRSFDAYAAGAVVLSDVVKGFTSPKLPDLLQLESGTELIKYIKKFLEKSPDNLDIRCERNKAVTLSNSFKTSAQYLKTSALKLVQKKQITQSIFKPKNSGTATCLQLKATEASQNDQIEAVKNSAQEIISISKSLEKPKGQKFLKPLAVDRSQEGVLHSLMYDQRRAQSLALAHRPTIEPKDVKNFLRAYRALEVADDPRIYNNKEYGDALLTYYIDEAPLWNHSPLDYRQDDQKEHIQLWPRKNLVALDRPIGIFLHLYYHDLSEYFANILKNLKVPHKLYISTDNENKASHIDSHFPNAVVRVFQNRGRDIYPKFFGFLKAYEEHDIVLHLHGKKSTHSQKLDKWLEHNLECILPIETEINRIISFFKTIPFLGIVAPVMFPKILRAAHWGANYQIGKELHWRMKLGNELPKNDQLIFPAGSMFWARTAALRPLLNLRLGPNHFPEERGQIDGTAAHAIERLIGVSCFETGYKMIRVASKNNRVFMKFRKTYSSNGALRDAISSSK